MTEDQILEVGIDQAGSLYLKPRTQSFPFIYRAAMEVGWDAENQRLFSPMPREWTYLDWFRQLLAAAADEYGVRLKVSSATVWSDVPEALRAQIEADQAR